MAIDRMSPCLLLVLAALAGSLAYDCIADGGLSRAAED